MVQGVNIDAFQKFDFGSAAENTMHYNQVMFLFMP